MPTIARVISILSRSGPRKEYDSETLHRLCVAAIDEAVIAPDDGTEADPRDDTTVESRLEDIIWGATEAAHVATEADKWGNASRALTVVRLAQTALRRARPADDDPFAYDANGPQHTTARVPRGMTREAFEPLLIEWIHSLECAAACPECGGPMPAGKRPHAVYCSANCRKAASAKRVAAGLPESE